MTAASGAMHKRDDALFARYREVRAASERLAAPLSPEDCQVQSMPEASPTKWHLAHMSWFFETFVLAPHLPGHGPFDPAYAELFNSYYVGVGPRHPRPERGLLSRPRLEEIRAWRRHVDQAMEQLIAGGATADCRDMIELGLQHEQQHQELILMDIKHLLSRNSLEPAYEDGAERLPGAGTAAWSSHPAGLMMIGNADGFAFDNEGPRHRLWLDSFSIAQGLVSAGDYQAFIADGGYRRPELWLSDGWTAVEREGWEAPLYWRRQDGEWTRFTLAGRRPVEAEEPVLHVSFYEAEAFARWAGRRLPTEAEWEAAAEAGCLDLMDDAAWQWTASAYAPYPGFRPSEGAVGEYNGKFMVNQMVLRGGSFATPAGHARPSYRNFFPPEARWIFAGIRLASDTSFDAGGSMLTP